MRKSMGSALRCSIVAGALVALAQAQTAIGEPVGSLGLAFLLAFAWLDGKGHGEALEFAKNLDDRPGS